MRARSWMVLLSVAGMWGTPGSGVANAAPGLFRVGLLSPASNARPEAVADRFLAAERTALAAPLSELGRPVVTPVGRGFVARYRQLHDGIPVIGAGVTLRIDDAGRVRRIAASTFAIGALDLTPGVDADRAVTAARARGAAGARSPGSTTLAIDPRAAGGPRLVWAVRLVPVPELLENAIYLVDAQSGKLLKRIDLLRYAQASVFLQNPENTPSPKAMDFPTGFQPTSADGKLTSALVQGYDCIDDDKTTSFQGINVHICTVTQEATANASGDYTQYQPAMEPWKAPENGCPNAPYGTTTVFDGGAPDGGNMVPLRQPLDEFSEQHMYWHVAQTYDFFRGLFADGGTAAFQLRQHPLPVAVNLCTPDFSGGLSNLTGPLVPFNNAFYSPGLNNPISQALIGGKDSIMFGQGPSYDFAYDGDVIAHEFTHAVIDTLGKLTTSGFEDTQGLNDDPGAMNEGLADYFSSALGGDAKVGEYAGRNIPGAGAEGAIRDLDNMDQCAADRWGEVHQDSQAFSAGLWGARLAIAGDPHGTSFDAAKARLFDRAVLAAIQGFGDTPDMPTAAASVADEAGMLLDAAAKQAVEDSFAQHAILPACERVIEWSGKKKDLLFLDGIDSVYAPAGAGRVPSHLQWKIDVPGGQDSITAQMNVVDTGGGNPLGGSSPPKLELAVGPQGMPIVWNVGTDGGNQTASAAFSAAKGMVTATLTGLSPGPNYVMILNSGGSGSVAEEISFSTNCSQAGGCAGADAGVDGGASLMPQKGGCSCELGGHAPLALAPLALALLALLGLALRRRA